MNSRLSAVIFGSGVAGVALLALLDAAAKGFVLLAFACAVTFAMRRAPASARHLVWLASLACALVLPVCSWVLPGWRVLPAWMRWEEIPRQLVALPTAAPSFAPGPSLAKNAVAPTRMAQVEIEPPVPAVLPLASAPVSGPRAVRVSANALFALWAVGAALLLAPLAWSAVALGRVSRRAAAVRDGRIAAHVAAIAHELGLRRRVLVLLGDAGAMPMVWGLFRAHLLLPVSAADWPDARLRGVLLHELAHLRRRDPLALLVAQLALALHWFNPLAWIAVRRLRAEQERACDDFVLRHGIRASEYATDLLAVATGLRAQPFAAVALTMAHPARIEGRIACILDAACNRTSVTRWLVFSTVLLAAVIALPLAMLRAAEEQRGAVESGAPVAPSAPQNAAENSGIGGVVTTADSAEIAVNEKRGALAFITGEGDQARGIVHEFGGGTRAITFRVSADDRQGKWWDQARVVREGEFEASIPELPGDWLPRGRVVFLASPTKRADGAVVFAEIEAPSGKSVLAVRSASQREIGDASYRKIPRTCPEMEINLDCRVYALGANAPAKEVILPVLAAQDLTGPPRGALSFPYLTLKPGLPGTYDRMAGRAETVEATATMAGGRVHVAGSVVLRLVEGKYVSAAEAFRQSEDSFRTDSKTVPGNQFRAQFSATLGSNDALVVPIASDGTFPETLVASMTALPRRLSRVRWMPPAARSPIELDGWVLTWPRVEREWFASNFAYQGLPTLIAHHLEQRKDTTVKWITDEAVGSLNQEEVDRLVAAFHERSGVTAERVERFSAKQNISGFPSDEDRTHFKAVGEGASVLPTTDERYISPYLKWDAPVFQHLSAPASYGLHSGTSFCVLLPGPADPEKIRMLVLRCVDPDIEPRPKSAAAERLPSAPVVAGKDGAAQLLAPAAQGGVEAQPADPKAPGEQAKVDIGRDGAISLNGKAVTLAQLKAAAVEHPWQTVQIHAEKEVSYAKVVETVDALKAAGVTDFFFRAAQVGDGKFRVANRTGEYDLGAGQKLYLCRPAESRQWFTVIWPAAGPWPRSRLSIYPNISEQTRDQWAVVWEPGTEVLWWADGSDVGKMRVTDPAEVIVTREGRENNFARDFALPDEVKEEFRRLGFVIGRDKTPGREMLIGGNTGGQSILSAETQEQWSIEGIVTDVEGRSLANVPVRVSSNQVVATVKTNGQGNYRADFRLDFGTLAKWRAITVEPVLEGFTERDMAKAGEFNALLQGEEQPQRVRSNGEGDFQPGPIPRFAGRDIVPGTPGRVDFVMLAAREITGEILTADGQPAPPHWVVATTPEQRPGHSAAIQLSDAEGRFRLTGIPANRPVMFTVNPDGKPSETSKSAADTFESAGPHRIRIVLPKGGSGNGALEVEHVAVGEKEPAERARPLRDR